VSDTIDFSSNYSDESTDKGFQFESTCGRCNNGMKTRIRALDGGKRLVRRRDRQQPLWWRVQQRGRSR
jgi:hypothetical protein